MIKEKATLQLIWFQFTIYTKEYIQLLSLLLHGSDGWMYFACMRKDEAFPSYRGKTVGRD